MPKKSTLIEKIYYGRKKGKVRGKKVTHIK